MLKTAKKIKMLIFHPALSPYRVDLFNALAELLSVKVIFLREMFQVRYCLLLGTTQKDQNLEKHPTV